MAVPAKTRPYKVTEITDIIRSMLEAEFSDIAIEGEISNFRPSSTGHYYFTLKDKDSVISAVMFRNRIGALAFMPNDGLLVVVRGSISVYNKKGSYQIICESMEKAGIGDILLMLEERKRRLAAEGLFDAARKRPLPLFPSRVAVVTSPTGAAVKDILRVLKRRNAGINLIILPAPVQGDEAAEVIAKQIETANRFDLGDVIIIGRGGGSLEDLLPFSEEIVVRAVAASRIPIISAVGHEVDVSLSDLAADLRAPTPSAAAEMVSASREDLLSQVRDMERAMKETLEGRIRTIKLLLSGFSKENLERNFRILLQPFLLRLDDAKETLIYGLKNTVKEKRHRYELLSQALISASPFEILKRGYALVTDSATKRVVSAGSQAQPGEALNIRFYASSIDALVKEIHEHDEF